jgi:hypothetical protein
LAYHAGRKLAVFAFIIFFASFSVFGSLTYAQINGLSLTGDTYTVNFDIESGFNPNQLYLNYGDNIRLNMNVAPIIYEPQPAGFQSSFSFDGKPIGTGDLSDVVTFTTMEDGGSYYSLININGVGVHRISLYAVYVGQEGQPVFQQTYELTVTIYAPQVLKTLTLGVSGPGNVFCGPNPTTSEVQVYSGESNKVYTKDQYSIVYLRARPSGGSVFAYWLMGDGSHVTDQDPVITLSEDTSAMAVFTQQAVLTVSTDGLGYVTVAPPLTNANVDTVGANTVKSLQHPFGTVITLHAWSLQNCVFDYWQINGAEKRDVVTSFTLSAATSVSAHFKYSATPSPTGAPSNPVDVSVSLGGMGRVEWQDLSSGASGTVSKTTSPLGTGTVTVNSGAVLRLTAVPDSNRVFQKYDISGRGLVYENPCEVTAVSGLTVAAYFVTTSLPTEAPWTPSPTLNPTNEPTVEPYPTDEPTPIPVETTQPTIPPTASPTPTATPTYNPSAPPTATPVSSPTPQPFWIPKGDMRIIAWVGSILGLIASSFLLLVSKKLGW